MKAPEPKTEERTVWLYECDAAPDKPMLRFTRLESVPPGWTETRMQEVSE